MKNKNTVLLDLKININDNTKASEQLARDLMYFLNSWVQAIEISERVSVYVDIPQPQEKHESVPDTFDTTISIDISGQIDIGSDTLREEYSTIEAQRRSRGEFVGRKKTYVISNIYNRGKIFCKADIIIGHERYSTSFSDFGNTNLVMAISNADNAIAAFKEELSKPNPIIFNNVLNKELVPFFLGFAEDAFGPDIFTVLVKPYETRKEKAVWYFYSMVAQGPESQIIIDEIKTLIKDKCNLYGIEIPPYSDAHSTARKRLGVGPSLMSESRLGGLKFVPTSAVSIKSSCVLDFGHCDISGIS